MSAVAPMRLFICKVASRCNLDCDYCYVYKFSDQSWRHQPVRMSLETAAQLGKRIHEHANQHGLESVDLVFHGGEPFLIGLESLEQLCVAIRENVADTKIRFRTQTNGTLFDADTLDFCLRWDITVGLSLDGPKSYNDRHRLDFHRQSSFDRVEGALRLLSSEKGRSIWSGFLTVIDIDNDPVKVYEYLASWNPRSIEFLLPLAHYETWPKGKASFADTPYADWLLKVYERWYHTSHQTITIRRFKDIISLLFGVENSTEEWGLQPVDFAVIETNGEIQAVDTLKVTYSGANNLNLNIFDNSFDDMYKSTKILERQLGLAHLCNTCQTCKYVHVCGGGYYPHRYSAQNGFQNPSIYCRDIIKMIDHIYASVQNDIQQVSRRNKIWLPTLTRRQ